MGKTRTVHWAGPEHRFTACGLTLTPGGSADRISTDDDRDAVTCVRCLGGAYSTREKLERSRSL